MIRLRLHLKHRRVLVVAILAGAAIGLLHRLVGFGREASILIGWCAATVVYMVPTAEMMRRSTPESIRRRAQQVDESEATVLTASIVAAVASLVGVGWFVAMLHSSRPWELALPVVTIVLSWTFIHLLFAVRYAHEYWQWDGGIDFPGDEKPLFGDFLYLSFTIGMTFQTSDVAFTARSMRRLALTHALVSFLFNVVIIAAAVNMAAGLVG